MNNAYSVYVQMDANSNITAVNSSEFLSDVTGWTKIDEGVGDKCHHAQGNYFDKPIMTAEGVCCYKLADGAVVEKTTQEITEETSKIVVEPSETEKLRADVDFLAVMTGVTI